MQPYTHIVHPFDAVFDRKSVFLVLGSLPSVKSREDGFYYGHPRNRFWQVLSLIFEEDIPQSTLEKKRLLLDHNIALWDVLHSCDISGSADSSIKNAIPNDIKKILAVAHIKRIIANGTAAFSLYKKFWAGKINIELVKMPSTSPANAAWSLEKLTKEWRNAFNKN